MFPPAAIVKQKHLVPTRPAIISQVTGNRQMTNWNGARRASEVVFKRGELALEVLFPGFCVLVLEDSRGMVDHFLPACAQHVDRLPLVEGLGAGGALTDFPGAAVSLSQFPKLRQEQGIYTEPWSIIGSAC